MAGCLRSSGQVWLSHRAAAARHGFTGCEKGRLEFLTTTRIRPADGHILHYVADMPPCDVEVVRGIPVTSPARTLLDLATVVDEETLEDHPRNQAGAFSAFGKTAYRAPSTRLRRERQAGSPRRFRLPGATSGRGGRREPVACRPTSAAKGRRARQLSQRQRLDRAPLHLVRPDRATRLRGGTDPSCPGRPQVVCAGLSLGPFLNVPSRTLVTIRSNRHKEGRD